MRPIDLSYTVKLTVTAAQVDEIIHCAIDGGIRYWCPKCSFGSVGGVDSEPNTFLVCEDWKEERTVKLTSAKVKRGLQLAAERYPLTFQSAFTADGDYDAGDADVILQLMLFGDIVYG